MGKILCKLQRVVINIIDAVDGSSQYCLEKTITNCLSNGTGSDCALSADINDFNAQNLT